VAVPAIAAAAGAAVPAIAAAAAVAVVAAVVVVESCLAPVLQSGQLGLRRCQDADKVPPELGECLRCWWEPGRVRWPEDQEDGLRLDPVAV
jgi:hypothetical protein